MAIKYYISSVIGDGSEENPYRPKICNYNIKSMGRTTQDGSDWCLCWVDTYDHEQWSDDMDINLLEEY